MKQTNKALVEILCYLIAVVAIALIVFTSYLFYFANCATLKQYWYLVHTPGRCI